MNEVMNFVAMATPPGGAQGQGGSNPLGQFGMLPFMVILFGIMYFMLIRPQNRREKERRKMIEGVKSGDRVMFSGGILGVVSNVKDDTVMVKVADNVKLEVARGAIVRVLEKDEKASVEEGK